MLEIKDLYFITAGIKGKNSSNIPSFKRFRARRQRFGRKEPIVRLIGGFEKHLFIVTLIFINYYKF